MDLAFSETALGWSAENAEIQIVFGGIRSSKAALAAAYPHLKFRQPHQVHGRLVLEDGGQDLEGVEADGLVGHIPGHALCVLSADCTPIMIYDPATRQIAALHAGWRGVANRILPAALERFANPSRVSVWIGPHIRQASFEIRSDAFELLTAASSAAAEKFAQVASPQSWFVDLSCILRSQLAEYGVSPAHVQILDLDTRSDLRLHSFRRDGKNAGRQTSFIVLKS